MSKAEKNHQIKQITQELLERLTNSADGNEQKNGMMMDQ